MSKNAIQQAQVTHFSHDGRGIARPEGKTTFIQGALPDERVSYQLTRQKKDFAEGRVVEVLEASPDRVEPRCDHYSQCGGCSLQHLAASRQIVEKQLILEDLLKRFAHTEPETYLTPLQADIWHYRNKARLSVRYVEKKESVLIGFRERQNPRYITEINDCKVLNAKLAADIPALRALLSSFEDLKTIAQIEVAAGDEAVALIFRNLNPLTAQDAQRLREFAEQKNYRVYLQPGGEDTVELFYPREGDQWLNYRLPAFDLDFRFYPTDFTQINASLNQSMIQQAISLLDLQPGDRVLDLFCGLGNFSLPIAQLCAKVIGVEGSEAMVARARMNADNNGLENLEFYAANLDDLTQVNQILHHPVNKMLIDPPRSGAQTVVEQIHLIKPERLVYVSCNPVTLARDIGILCEKQGYHLVSAGVMDMFPHTAHVESIALLIRK